MNITLFQAYNEFATISLCVAAAYLGLIYLTRLLADLAMRLREKHPAICRPGEIIHQGLKVTGRLWDHFRTAALLFGVSFLLLMNFGRYGWWVPLPTLANVAIATVLSCVLGYSLLKMIQLARYRRSLAALLEIHNQISSRLIEAQLRGNRVFYAVRVGDVVLDNVIVGRDGVYTLQLFTAPAGSDGVQCASGGLTFLPVGQKISLQPYSRAVISLSKALTNANGSKVTVLPVVVAPECKIEASDSHVPMIVSVQTCNAFIGWQEQGAFLLDEDVATISAWLASRELERVPRSVNATVGALQNHLRWPDMFARDVFSKG
jgi:hypothetical protein